MFAVAPLPARSFLTSVLTLPFLMATAPGSALTARQTAPPCTAWLAALPPAAVPAPFDGHICSPRSLSLALAARAMRPSRLRLSAPLGAQTYVSTRNLPSERERARRANGDGLHLEIFSKRARHSRCVVLSTTLASTSETFPHTIKSHPSSVQYSRILP